MPTQRILLFDGATLSALRWQKGRVVSDRQFTAGTDGQQALGEFIARHPGDLYRLIADIPEEGFQLETVPFVRGADRTALLTRRLGQYYYGSPLSAAISLGRTTDGRRDERILFAALTRPDALTPWLEVIKNAQVPLVGIYSVPLVLASQTWSLAAGKSRFLLCTITTSGVRQTYFVDGKMHFSRMAALPSTDTHAIAEGCARETNRTIQYLVGQRQLARGAHVSTYVLCHAQHTDVMRTHCIDSNDVEYHFVDLGALAAQMGCKTSIADSRADALIAHLLMARPPQQQFAPAVLRQPYQRWQIRTGLRTAAFALLVGLLALSSRFMMQAGILDAQSDVLTGQSMVDEKRYQALLAGLPKTPLSNDALRAVIGQYDVLASRTADIAPMLRHLGSVLADSPGIELNKLAWGVGEQVIDKTSPNYSRGGTAPNSNNAAKPASNALWVSLDIDAQLPPALLGDQRGQLMAIEQLAERLRSDAIEVMVTSTPVNIESAKSLRSSDYLDDADSPARAGANRDIDERLAFSLRLTRPLVTTP